MDPAWWAQVKAAQAATVQAGKAARREASARAIPVTDTEITLYGPGHQDVDGISQSSPPERPPQAEDGPGTETAHEARPLDAATEHDRPDARLSRVITEVEDAVQQIGGEQADRHARNQYAARLSRETQAQPEAMAELHADMAARTPAEAEIEM